MLRDTPGDRVDPLDRARPEAVDPQAAGGGDEAAGVGAHVHAGGHGNPWSAPSLFWDFDVRLKDVVVNDNRKSFGGGLIDHASGVTLVSITDGIDSSTCAGRIMIGVLGSLAEYERELTRERTALKRPHLALSAPSSDGLERSLMSSTSPPRSG